MREQNGYKVSRSWSSPVAGDALCYQYTHLVQGDPSMSTEQNTASLHRAATHFSTPANRPAYFDLYDANIVLHGYQGVTPGIASVRHFYTAFWAAFPDC